MDRPCSRQGKERLGLYRSTVVRHRFALMRPWIAGRSDRRGLQFDAVLGGEARVGQHVVLALVHQRRELGPARPELVGHLPPDLMRARLIGSQSPAGAYHKGTPILLAN